MGLRDWFPSRSGPTPSDRKPRVRLTLPSDGPHSAAEYLQFVLEDIEAVLEHDPAARNALEVVMVYPGLHALWLHRISHALWRRGWVLSPRVLAHLTRAWTGIEIHPGARFGRRVFIDHGMGIVVGETATVGDDCLLYKGAVLGGTSLERAERHPTLGKGVVVGTNACVLGPIHIGDGAKIGSNSVVVRDVPDHATAVGVPAKLAGQRRSAALDHADLPDPVTTALRAMMDEIEALRARLSALDGQGDDALKGRADELAAFDEPLR
jgi:serine O-acetyltransferase